MSFQHFISNQVEERDRIVKELKDPTTTNQRRIRRIIRYIVFIDKNLEKLDHPDQQPDINAIKNFVLKEKTGYFTAKNIKSVIDTTLVEEFASINTPFFSNGRARTNRYMSDIRKNPINDSESVFLALDFLFKELFDLIDKPIFKSKVVRYREIHRTISKYHGNFDRAALQDIISIMQTPLEEEAALNTIKEKYKAVIGEEYMGIIRVEVGSYLFIIEKPKNAFLGMRPHDPRPKIQT